MMLQGVPSAVSIRLLRDAPGVAVNGTVAGNHGNISYLLYTPTDLVKFFK